MNQADRSATRTLFYSPGACSLAPHIVLEEIGQPFSLVLVSTDRGETHTPEFLSVNPKGRIPVLVTGNTVLTEAPAILLHLAVVNPGAGLIQNSDENLVSQSNGSIICQERYIPSPSSRFGDLSIS